MRRRVLGDFARREAAASGRPMSQPIVGYPGDEVDDWVAELECGHNRHVRHNPP